MKANTCWQIQGAMIITSSSLLLCARRKPHSDTDAGIPDDKEVTHALVHHHLWRHTAVAAAEHNGRRGLTAFQLQQRAQSEHRRNILRMVTE